MTFDKRELKYLRIIAGCVGFTGVIGLLALLAQGAFAADVPTPGKGLQPGARTLANPFANGPSGAAGKNNFFDDDEEDDEAPIAAGAPGGMIPPPPVATGGGYSGAGEGFAPAGNPALNAGGVPISANGPAANFGPNGVSVGGGTAGGVVEHNSQRSVHIDDETGEGSKEVVTDFNYPDADIMDIAKTLGRLMGKNFIYDKDVKGRISILSNGPITVGDAWKAFLTALDISGFALIPSGRYIRIARQRDARDKQLKTYTGDFSPDTDALITRVFPLKYIQAEEVARTFRSFMPANSRIIPYEQTNTVIVTDTGSNISKLNKMLELLDVEGYDAGIEVIPVKFASAAELSKLIDALIPGTGGAAGSAPGAPRFGGGSGGHFQSRRTKEGGIINTIISDERTNTLIVHANTKGADQVRELVAKLDQKQPAVTGGGKVHVVYLQFAEAEKIAATLNNISSQTAGAGFHPTTPGAGGTGVNPVAASLFEGQIKIAPDVATNALVVTASPADFVTVERVISRLDIPRDEVYVECIVMEIDISRSGAYSANIISLPSGIGSVTSPDLFNFIKDPTSVTGALLGFVGGKQTSVTINNVTTQVSSVQGLVKALQTYAKTNVLATPQIIALDNSEATFISAEKIPVPQITAVQGAGTTTGVTKESVELSIKIKPQINKISNFVKLETEIKIGDISPAAVGNVGGIPVFNTLDRSAKTTVVVGDSDTIVIGGLIRDKSQETVQKIPILGDIPVLGWLFKSKTSQVDKTNLVVFMTPHIIRQYDKVRALLDKKLKDRDDFIEKEAGGDDPDRPARDDMIRSLPDLKDINAKLPNSSVSIDEDKPAAKEVDPSGNPFTEKPSDGSPGGPGGGTNPAPLMPPSASSSVPPAGSELNVPKLPPSRTNTGSAEPAPPAPPAPGAQPANPPGSGT